MKMVIMRIAIVGSRSINNKEAIFKELASRFRVGDILISGGAAGVDSIAEEFAVNNNYEMLIFKPKGVKPADYLARNRLIVENSDLVLAFWDGISTGTIFTYNYALKRGIKAILIRYKHRKAYKGVNSI